MLNSGNRKQTRVEPSVRVTDRNFSYQRGADVQSTWRKFGWLAPSEYKPTPVFVEKAKEWEPVRRVK